MSEISKPDYTYLWSSGGAIVAPSNVKIQTGWTAEVPPFQWENWSQNRQDAAISHILQKGISVWSSTGEYYFTTSGERSYVQGSDGNIYVSVADSVGQDPTTDATDTYWKRAFTSTNPVATSTLNLKMIVTTASFTASVTADEIIAASSLGGLNYKISGYNTIINLATVGSGGMDVGTAPVSGYVAIYAIHNPISGVSSVMAVNATSAIAPAVYAGVNYPTGYTASALLTVVPTNASSQFKVCVVRGRMVNIQLGTFFSFAANIPGQNITIANFIPPNAIEVFGELSAACNAVSNITISVNGDNATATGQQNLSTSVTSTVAVYISNFSNVLLTTPQTIGIGASTTAGTPNFSYYVGGYKI